MTGAFEAILLDLDGTLVADDGHLRPRVLRRLKDLHERGVKILIATGRSEAGTREVIEELGLDMPAVVFNGAAIYCPIEGRLIEERILADEVVAQTVRWCAGLDMLPIVIGAGAKYALAPRTEFEERALGYFHDRHTVALDEFPTENIIRVTILSSVQENSTELRLALGRELQRPVYITDFALSWLPLHRDSPLLVADVQPPCRGKGEGVRFLQERYGIDPKRVVAVGDATNDIPMFEAAGLSVAMGNSMPAAKESADRVIGDNNTDALAELLDELF